MKRQIEKMLPLFAFILSMAFLMAAGLSLASVLTADGIDTENAEAYASCEVGKTGVIHASILMDISEPNPHGLYLALTEESGLVLVHMKKAQLADYDALYSVYDDADLSDLPLYGVVKKAGATTVSLAVAGLNSLYEGASFSKEDYTSLLGSNYLDMTGQSFTLPIVFGGLFVLAAALSVFFRIRQKRK